VVLSVCVRNVSDGGHSAGVTVLVSAVADEPVRHLSFTSKVA